MQSAQQNVGTDAAVVVLGISGTDGQRPDLIFLFVLQATNQSKSILLAPQSCSSGSGPKGCFFMQTCIIVHTFSEEGHSNLSTVFCECIFDCDSTFNFVCWLHHP